eukprot:364756-Chlamydomonas_euryale.AAC.11
MPSHKASGYVLKLVRGSSRQPYHRCTFTPVSDLHTGGRLRAGFAPASHLPVCVPATPPSRRAALQDQTLYISRGTSVILLTCYISYLVFQLYTHIGLFKASDEESEQPVLSLPVAITMLTAITVIVAFASEFLTGSIEEVSEATGLGQAFLGMIVLPIAGNACEHITAIIVAMKNKMDLALGVAVGSSIQIALFAIPFVVVVAWAQGLPFSLVFDPFSALALALSVIHANNVTADAISHWLLGVQLVAVYVIIAYTYLFR